MYLNSAFSAVSIFTTSRTPKLIVLSTATSVAPLRDALAKAVDPYDLLRLTAAFNVVLAVELKSAAFPEKAVLLAIAANVAVPTLSSAGRAASNWL